jgi:hypothetical protein
MPYTGPGYPAWWTVSQTYEHQGTTVVRGQELTIRNQRGGRFTFYDHVIAPPRPGSGKRKPAEWITVLNQSGQAGQFRSFRPDQIGRIMRPKRKARSR